jgi:hypothetical protein
LQGIEPLFRETQALACLCYFFTFTLLKELLLFLVQSVFSTPLSCNNGSELSKNGFSSIDSLELGFYIHISEPASGFDSGAMLFFTIFLAGAEKGSKDPQLQKVGKVTIEQLREIATEKLPDLNCTTVESAMRIVAGTAANMGIDVVPPLLEKKQKVIL